jgi:hypothetical protein
MAKKYTVGHAHDYSVIECPNGTSLEISTPEPMDFDDKEEVREYEEAQENVETVVDALNKGIALKRELKWSLKQMRSLGCTDAMEKRFVKAEKLL